MNKRMIVVWAGLLAMLLSVFGITIAQNIADPSTKTKTMLVRYKKGALGAETRLRQKNISQYKKLKADNLFSVNVTKKELKALMDDKDIDLIEEDSQVKKLTDKITWNVEKVGAPILYSKGYYGSKIKVAVFDTGIELRDTDLYVSSGVSFIDGTFSYQDDNGHGTAVAGVLAAIKNNYGLIGVSPEISLYAVKVLDQDGLGRYSSVINGIQWAIENGIDIIVMSFGGTQYSRILEDTIHEAVSKNILVVAAAGNDGNDKPINYPAKYSDVVCVGAVDRENKIAPFSNSGPEMDLVAPGVGIESIGLAYAQAIVNGTSAAAPHVAGVAAQLWSAKRELTAEQIKALIYSNTTPLGEKKLYGFGLINAGKALDNINSKIDLSVIVEPVTTPSPPPVIVKPVATPSPTEGNNNTGIIRALAVVESGAILTLKVGETKNVEIRFSNNHDVCYVTYEGPSEVEPDSITGIIGGKLTTYTTQAINKTGTYILKFHCPGWDSFDFTTKVIVLPSSIVIPSPPPGGSSDVQQAEAAIDAILQACDDGKIKRTQATALVNEIKAQINNLTQQTNKIKNQKNTPNTGDPVKIATGAFTTSESDLEYQYGNFMIGINRTYQSDRIGSHSFGPYWSFNYDTRIIMGVKPRAQEELQELRALEEETYNLYTQAKAYYDENLPLITAAHAEAVQALEEATDALDAAEDAVKVAEDAYAELLKDYRESQEPGGTPIDPPDDSFVDEAKEVRNQAKQAMEDAEKLEREVYRVKQELEDSYSEIQALYADYQKIKDLADQSEREYRLAVSNTAKNTYTFNTADPSYLQHTGNNTLTFIDEEGVPHLYIINTPPDYFSRVTYPNGQTNFFPNGATLTAALPDDDRIDLLADGSYRLTKKEKTQYLYSYFGQLTSITDPNGNRTRFEYSASHELIRIADDYNRTLVIERQNGKISKITDPKGREFRYSYYANGMLAGRTDAENATVGYRYDNERIVEITKPDGSSRKYYYKDLDGRKVVDRTVDEEGGTETFSYTPGGMQSTYVNASGVTERHYYNDRFLTTKIEYQDGSYVEMGYDNDNNLIRSRNQLGQVYQYSYDPNRNLIRSIDPDNKAEEWTYNGFNKVASYKDKVGNTTIYNYDTSGNLTSINYPDGSSVSYSYNQRGQIVNEIDQLKNRTTYDYDNYGYIAKVTDAEGHIEAFRNDLIGNILTYTDQTGNSTNYEYNGDNKVVRITDAAGKTENYRYNIRKDLVQAIDKNGQLTSYEYNKSHLLKKVVNPLGETVEYQYRADGKPTEKIINGTYHTVYTYNARGNLASEQQVETGAVTRYEYNAAGQPVAKIDPNGNRTEYGYNTLGSLRQVKDPEGNIRTINYYPNQKISALTDERGNTTTFEYDKLNRVIRITDPAQNSIRFSYDPKGNLVQSTDQKGNTESFQYDKVGQVVKLIDPLGNFETREYDPRRMLTALVDKNGNRNTYFYDSLNQLTKEVNAIGGTKEYTYDPMGNILSQTNENGANARFVRDALGRVTVETNVHGSETHYRYNSLGKISAIIDALNNTNTFEYNAQGRLTKETDALGGLKTYQYDKNGNLVLETNQEGFCKAYQYDKLDRLVATFDALNQKTAYLYDPNSNLIRETDPLGLSKTFTYDNLDRLVETVDALNQKTTYQYDPKGNLSRITNPKGDTSQYEYDAADRLVREYNFMGNGKSYTLDPAGNITAQIDFNGNRTGYQYDPLHRMVTTVYPDGSKKEFTYDALGNLTKAVNNSADQRFYYDELSRLVKAETLGLVPGQTKKAEFTYNKVDSLTSTTVYGANDAPRRTNYAYDELQRLVKATLPESNEVTFRYDKLSQVIERINANGTSMVYSYTPRSEVESIINYQDPGRTKIAASFSYIYNAKGQRIYQVEGSGALTAYQYDPAGRIKETFYPLAKKKVAEDLREQMYYGLLPDSDSPCSLKLNFQPELSGDAFAGLLTRLQELETTLNEGLAPGTVQEIKVAPGANALPFVNNLSIDSGTRARIEGLYQKIRTAEGVLNLDSGFWKEEFTYDPNGNVSGKRNGWGEINYRYNKGNQLTQAGSRVYAYDPNGNLLNEMMGAKHAEYKYDYENRLVKVTNQFQHFLGERPFRGEIGYEYDALSRKVSKDIKPLNGNNHSREYYIYDGLDINILAEYEYELKTQYPPEGELKGLNEYNYGNGMLLAVKTFDFTAGGKKNGNSNGANDPLKDLSFYHYDALGSVVMLTGRNGQVVERYDYDVYGHAFDGWFELNKNRPNPFGYTGKRFENELGIYTFAYREYNPRTMRWLTEDPAKDGLNWHGYCNADPVNHVDPDGLWFESAWDAFSLVTGVISFVDNVKKGNVRGAILDGIGIVADTVALIAPGVPGGAGAGIKALRAGTKVVDKVSDTVRLVDNTSNVRKVVKQAGIVNELAKVQKPKLHRPYIRKEVRKIVESRANKTIDGKFMDANTGKVIEGKYDLGHKKNHEFKREREIAEREGLSQKEFNDKMNNPDYYQIEDPSSNRSRKYESKKNK